MTENSEYIIDIQSVSSDGSGIGHIDGRAVFVPYAASGDRVKVRIRAVKPRFARAELIDVLSPSPDRIAPSCPAYGECGGCSLRHITYKAELDVKRDIVENAMRRIGGFKTFTLSAVTGMEKPERYRNKTVFHAKNGELGFFAQKSHSLIPVCDCMIGIEENREITAAVRECIKADKSAVKQLFIRKAFATGELMVVIYADRGLKCRDMLIEKLAELNVSSVILNVNGSIETIYGKSAIYDILCGIKFEISPQSFFQINPIQTEKLYNTALRLADIKPEDTVMDIYCGIGTISLCAAKRAGKVIGVELVSQAIEDAKKNAAINGIKNACFYAGKAEKLVPWLVAGGESPNIVILDPPRSGSDEKTLKSIVRACPDRVVYVSCNPATLARDAAFLAQNGYFVSDAEAFDMFPRTSHVETVVLFCREKG